MGRNKAVGVVSFQDRKQITKCHKSPGKQDIRLERVYTRRHRIIPSPSYLTQDMALLKRFTCVHIIVFFMRLLKHFAVVEPCCGQFDCSTKMGRHDR
ncbi:hypothetical protein EVAR_65027_1 [Eumeta japonica]|uniref:Uncharacterized protein n=1 Tax=Eumeta variegata TaxID=151549 RepID=A0A4C1YVA7_EUMVA|nr:hypothetical protein EVAR_65027_1 [Eumeta japonica]